jgi:hypothetical protein
MNEYTLQEMLRSADADGNITFLASEYKYLKRNEQTPLSTYIRSLVAHHLLDFEGMLTHFQHTKSANKALGIWATQTEWGSSDYRVTVNLAKVFRLAAENPAQELQELANFLDGLKPYFHARASAIPYVAVASRWSSNTRTEGIVECLYRVGDKRVRDEEASRQTMATIKASPVLAHWVSQQAKDMRKQKYGNFILPHRFLFKLREDPVEQALSRQVE